MLTNALLLKISIAFAALLTLLGLWYREYHSTAAKEAALIDRIEQGQNAHKPTRAQIEEAKRHRRTMFSGYDHFQKHALDGLNGEKK